MFKPPSLLAIQVIPTATVFPLGSHGVYIRAKHVSLPPHAPDMLSVRNEQLTEGDFHPISLTALSATPTRSSALGASVRLGVRDAFWWGRFPLARPLPSIPSAAGCPALFGDFSGTVGRSDFPCSFIIGVCPWTSRCVPGHIPSGVNAGSPGSHARCFRTCTGSLTARDSSTPRDIGAPDGAFRILLQRRRPGVSVFRGCIPGPHGPLSTLRRRPREQLPMTR